MAAFLEDPFLPGSTQMRLDTITAMLALLFEDFLRSTAMHLLYQSYNSEDSTYIWSLWEPHIRLPSTHPLAEGTLARDCILVMLQMEYITPKHAAEDAQAVTDIVTVAIPVETFILYTVVTL